MLQIQAIIFIKCIQEKFKAKYKPIKVFIERGEEMKRKKKNSAFH